MSTERNVSLLRRLLNRDGVKLWLEPYTQENSPIGNFPQDFISKYSEESKLQPSDVKAIFEQLRNNAIKKLDSGKKFRETGIATLKLKIAQSQSTIPELSLFTVETSLNVTGYEFKVQASSSCNINSSSIRLIFSGTVINDAETLEVQKVKNNSTLLVLVINKSEKELRQMEQEVYKLKEVQHVKNDVKLLLNSSDYSRLEITDQNGKVINIPDKEKQALGIAMTLNEKGRTFMKKQDYASALIFLLEADQEFMRVKWDVLNVTDNYPILCLDIVWCYLCLSSVSDLHDAEKRLATSEKFLNQSYGQNWDRLLTIKGSSGCEAALFARLHLLQGVLAFHQNRLKEAEKYLNQVKNEIISLEVDDAKVSKILAMGYTPKEARLSLRHCNGDVSLAASFITNKREEKKKRTEEEKVERMKKRKTEMLGKTSNGEAVSVELYECMLNMGFSSNAAICALRKANNSISIAVDLLNENPNLANEHNEVPENAHQMLMNLCDAIGFDYNAALSVLERNNMNFEFVKNMLLNSGASAATSSFEAGSQFKTDEAASRLSAEIDFDEEDYLDINLQQEQEFLHHYLEQLSKVDEK